MVPNNYTLGVSISNSRGMVTTPLGGTRACYKTRLRKTRVNAPKSKADMHGVQQGYSCTKRGPYYLVVLSYFKSLNGVLLLLLLGAAFMWLKIDAPRMYACVVSWQQKAEFTCRIYTGASKKLGEEELLCEVHQRWLEGVKGWVCSRINR